MSRRGPATGWPWPIAAAALIVGCSPGVGPSSGSVPAPPVPARSGVGVPAAPGAALSASASYAASQAADGREVFRGVCSSCHAETEFRGQIFNLTWKSRPIGDFFQLIAATMPQDAPGSLTATEYAAVVAYVLQLSGHPPGEVELAADSRVLDRLAWPR
jgi:S-disulfanyl-L-cysteine oxidoreductase SoxD